jgi:hypothetical protein
MKHVVMLYQANNHLSRINERRKNFFEDKIFNFPEIKKQAANGFSLEA